MTHQPAGSVEPDLVDRFLAGEPRALRQVESFVRRAALPFRGQLRDEWEDLLQEGLARAVEALRQRRLRGEGSLGAYVRRAVCNLCVDRLRSRRTWQWVGLDGLDFPSAAPSPLDAVRRREFSLELLRVLEEVPGECRELWGMVLAGLSYREMSVRLGVGEVALRSRVLRCRRRAVELRRRLADGSGPVGATDQALDRPRYGEEGA